MKKQQFIQELSSALATVDAQTRNEIIADISDHFAEGASNGLSEEEICRNLGQPSQIAEQVMEEYKSAKGQGNAIASALQAAEEAVRAATENISSNMEDVHIDFNTIENAAYSTANDAVRMASDALRAAAEGIRGSMGGVQRAADKATRIRGGYEIDIDMNFHGITAMDINLNICNLFLVPAAQGEAARVTIKGRSKYNMFEVANRNGTLIINEGHPIVRFEIFNFKSDLTATVYVPAGFMGDIKGKVSFGNISASNVGGNLTLHASAGNISLNEHKSSSAKVRSSAGNIRIVNCDVDHISAKSSAGNVSAEGQEIRNLDLKSSAGNVDARVTKISGDVSLSTSAGDVRLEAWDVQGNITAKSSVGGVHIYLPRDVNCRIDLKKPSIGSASNFLTGNPNSPYVLRAAGSVGSVTLEAID